MKKYLNFMLLCTATIIQAADTSKSPELEEKLLPVRIALWFNHVRSVIIETIQESKENSSIATELPIIQARLLSEIAEDSLTKYRTEIENFHLFTQALSKLQSSSASLPPQLKECFKTKEAAINYFKLEVEILKFNLCTQNLSPDEEELLQNFGAIMRGTRPEPAEKLFAKMQRIQDPEFHNQYPSIESLRLPPLE